MKDLPLPEAAATPGWGKSRRRFVCRVGKLERALLLMLMIAATAIAEGQAGNVGRPFGERFHEWASETADAVKSTPAETGYDNRTCETCGRPTLFGTKKCFSCRSREAPAVFKQAVDDALNSSRNMLEALHDPRLTKNIIERLLAAKRQLQDQSRKDADYEKARQRRALEDLAHVAIGSDGRTLNDAARDAISKYLPALEGSDYSQDPARTLSYFLVLDGKGFIENVRCVRVSDGSYLTLLEAYGRFSGTDPHKAENLLELIDDIRKIGNPGEECGNERLPDMLDAVARGLSLLQNEP
ncbi:MAG: hypothetical protein HQM09_00845 [Candidatus Riflebacteria bacterium]|nr:hypothetical protein [Candidatus Riflebacteria bacterium]